MQCLTIKFKKQIQNVTDFFFIYLKRSGRKISVMSVTGLSRRHFGMSLHILGWGEKKKSGQKRLNKEMSSPDTPSKASECFGGEPELSCWIPSKLGSGALELLSAFSTQMLSNDSPQV